MPDTITNNRDFIAREAEEWVQIHNELMGFRARFLNNPDLLPLSSSIHPALDELIPNVNKAKNQAMPSNMKKGALVAASFSRGLIEIARAYGMTEDEATEISSRMI